MDNTPLTALRLSATTGEPMLVTDARRLRDIATECASITTVQILGRTYTTGQPHIIPANAGTMKVDGIVHKERFRKMVKATGSSVRFSPRRKNSSSFSATVNPPRVLVEKWRTLWDKWTVMAARDDLTHRQLRENMLALRHMTR